MSDRLTEQRLASSEQLDTLAVGDILRTMNAEDNHVVQAVNEALPQVEQAITDIVSVLEKGGRLFYIGAGTSGRLGVLDASECPPTFGVSPELVTGLIAGGDNALRESIENAEDNKSLGRQDIEEKVTAKDVVVGLATSGRTPYVLGAVEAARDIGAVTVGISCNPDTLLSQAVQYPIEVLVGSEVLTGSTRLKSGTAQKMILNMISTATMVQLGKVYGNLMVNVQASNDKLRQRVIGIVKEATAADDEKVEAAVTLADGDARVAILHILYDVDATEARDALSAAHGHFRRAMTIIDQQPST